MFVCFTFVSSGKKLDYSKQLVLLYNNEYKSSFSGIFNQSLPSSFWTQVWHQIMEQCRLSKEKCSILAYWKLSLNQLLSLFFRPPLLSELELLVSAFI